MFPGIGKHRVFFYPGDDLQNLDPFKLLAADLTGKNSTMAEHDLIVVAARSEEGKAGFYILDGYAASARSEDHIGGGEWALSSCKK